MFSRCPILSLYIADAGGLEKSYVKLYYEWIGLGRREPSFQPGKHYRRNVCLSDQYFQEGSNGGCTILDMRLENEQSLETYSYDVSVNGVLFSDRIDCSQQTALGYRLLCKWLDFATADSRHIILTPLNGNCKTKRITGSMAGSMATGTVIGVVLGVLLVAGLSFYCVKRRRAAACRKSNDEASEAAASSVDGTLSAPGAVEEAVAHSNHIAIADK